MPETVLSPRTATADLPLVRLFPALADRLPRHPLTCLPTPVRRLERLGRARGIDDLWVKCDDVSSPLYGGNKPRKLEWLLGAAVRQGRRAVMTFGGIGTHHGLATTICARDAGLRTVLVLLPQPVTDHVRRCLLLDVAYGAELHFAPSVLGVARTAAKLLAVSHLSGEPLTVIPTGGTSPLGIIGYVNAGFELAEQVRAGLMPEPDAIFVPLGSGGTVAGLVLGCRLAGLRSRVVGVLVSDIFPPSGGRLAALARRTLRRLRRAAPDLPDIPLQARDFSIERGYLGRGYGAPTEAGVAARQLAADSEGLTLETTYTAKCLAAMLDLAARPNLAGQTVLFWNTYSSIDPGASLDAVPDWHALPSAFHRFFAG